MELDISSIFTFTSYKKYLSNVIKRNSKIRGLYKILSEAANCQRSYLSQVMRQDGKIQLTPDQALGISRFLLHSAKERDYFLLLVDYERAASKELKELLQNKISFTQKELQDLTNLLERPKEDDHEMLIKFYSTWMYSYIHILTSISEYQSVEAIAKKSNLSVESALNILIELEDIGLVFRESGLWKHSGRQLHLDSQSALICNNHNNWRQQAILDAQLKQTIDAVHFSGVYSISKSDYAHIKTQILECLKAVNTKALSSGAEEVIVFCCDLFRK